MLDPDLVFRLANTAALLGWVALVLSPARVRWAGAVRRVTGLGLPVALSLLYIAMLAVHWRGQGGFGSLAEVRALFEVPGALVAGWVHYLAFDLFVGTWIARQAATAGIGHGWVLPCLALTFLFGPSGLLAYAAIAAFHRRLPA
jgi:hypothetical protein